MVTKVRLNSKKDFNKNLPATAIAIINEIFKTKTRKTLSFSISKLPPTVNRMYERGLRNTYLSKEAQLFRKQVCIALSGQKGIFLNDSVHTIMIFFESPSWITKKATVREMDCDNRIKALLDAIQHAIGLKDEKIWEIHCWKVASRSEKTTVYLFEMGDVIDFYT